MASDNTKRRLGVMPCEGSRCKSHDKSIPVVVFKNAKDTLSYRCDYCDRAPYARPGTDQHDDWMQDIRPFADKPPDKIAKPGAVVVPGVPSAEDIPDKIAPKKIKKAFDMGDL
ncbi:MAG: hypothetical protein Q7U78_05960 [Gallionella sp.]|nr:hypothetical protein [Gallionella sp.]